MVYAGLCGIFRIIFWEHQHHKHPDTMCFSPTKNNNVEIDDTKNIHTKLRNKEPTHTYEDVCRIRIRWHFFLLSWCFQFLFNFWLAMWEALLYAVIVCIFLLILISITNWNKRNYNIEWILDILCWLLRDYTLHLRHCRTTIVRFSIRLERRAMSVFWYIVRIVYKIDLLLLSNVGAGRMG